MASGRGGDNLTYGYRFDLARARRIKPTNAENSALEGRNLATPMRHSGT